MLQIDGAPVMPACRVRQKSMDIVKLKHERWTVAAETGPWIVQRISWHPSGRRVRIVVGAFQG
jgi:hypothetical protein